MKLSKDERTKLTNALKKRPRTVQDLLRIHGYGYLEAIKALSKKETILHKIIWDDGWRITYWIRPQRMGSTWRKVYSSLNIPASYDIDMNQKLDHTPSEPRLIKPTKNRRYI